jgi:hypothetical protein
LAGSAVDRAPIAAIGSNPLPRTRLERGAESSATTLSIIASQMLTVPQPMMWSDDQIRWLEG